MLSLAWKNTVLLTTVRRAGNELLPPGQMSLTNCVPVVVPSDFHSSTPWVTSLAIKNSSPFTLVSSIGLELPPVLMSLTMTVPAEEPSDFQSSTPLVPSLALKKSSPLTFTNSCGPELLAPGQISL